MARPVLPLALALALAAAPARAQAPAAAPAATPAAAPAAVRSPAPPARPPAKEKLAQGDRSFAEGNLRAALFAYQDAVYLEPGAAGGHVRLGLAYFALRYPARAVEQARLALALQPTSEEARALLEEARAYLEESRAAPARSPPSRARTGRR
jgi:tetratricopeptide (TPR) repeat protein